MAALASLRAEILIFSCVVDRLKEEFQAMVFPCAEIEQSFACV
jgi:hypothetical protein